MVSERSCKRCGLVDTEGGGDFAEEVGVPCQWRTLQFGIAPFAHVVRRDNNRNVLDADRRGKIEYVLNCIVADRYTSNRHRLAVNQDVTAEIGAAVRLGAFLVRSIRIRDLQRKIVAGVRIQVFR